MKRALIFLALCSSLHAWQLPVMPSRPDDSARAVAGGISSGISSGPSGFVSDCCSYYVDPAGNDSSNGTTPGTAWATVSKANAANLQPGQSVGFKRGGTWRETLTPGQSGTAGSPITFGAYGSGAQPIISGADLVTSWSVPPAGGETCTGTCVFLADAETGNTTQFTSVSTAGTSTFAATTGSKDHGTYGFIATSDGTNVAYGSKTISAASDIYARYYVRVPTGFNLPADGNVVRSFQLVDVGASRRVEIEIRRNTTGVFQFAAKIPGIAFVGGNFGISLDTWYYVEVHWVVSATVGGLQWWVNGASQGSDFTRNTALQTITTINSGFILGGDNIPTAGSTVNIDDIEAATSGPIGAYAGSPYAPANVYQASVAWQPFVVNETGTRLISESTLGATSATGSWWYDPTGQLLYVHSTDGADPTTHTIEAYHRQYGVSVVGKNYITLSNLSFTGHQQANLTWGLGNFGSAININIPASTNGTSWTIQNCTFKNEGDTAIQAWFAFQASPPSGRTGSGLTISNNTFNQAHWASTYYGLAGQSISGWLVGARTPTSDSAWDHVTVSNNIVTQDITLNPTNDNIHELNGIDVVVTGGANLISSNVLSGVSHAINTYGFDNTSDIGVIRDNIIHDTADDFINTSDPFGAVKVYYNLGYNGLDNCIDMASGGAESNTIRYNFAAYHNTCYNTNNAGIVMRKCNNCISENNIFMNTGTTNDFGEISNIMHVKDSDSPTSNTTIPTLTDDYNLWLNVSGTNVVNVDTNAGQSWPTFAQWKTSPYTLNTHGVNADPLFTNAGSGDFTLQGGSPAIGTGIFVSGVSRANPPNIGAK